MPPPGRRLDDLEGFLARCQGRARKAATATEALENALLEAKRAQAEVDAEEREAAAKLEQLRAELAHADASMPDVDVAETASAAEAELAKLRARLHRTEAERDAAHLAAGCAPPEPQTALSQEAEAELEAQLQEAQRTFAGALAGGTATARQAGELAVLTAQVEAARSKRRRASADAAGLGCSTPQTPR